MAHFVFEFEYAMSWPNLLAGPLAGVLASVVFGAWSVRKVCQAPVMETLHPRS
ncbi:MAG: hypothetical protein HC848_03200 [Limnobacter sp.]|nr:hypothetical protein [Limnobacter sp.]